jgi:hypothetical protein
MDQHEFEPERAQCEEAHRNLTRAQLGMLRAMLEQVELVRRAAQREGLTTLRLEYERGETILREDGEVEFTYRENGEDVTVRAEQLPGLIEAFERKVASWGQ